MPATIVQTDFNDVNAAEKLADAALGFLGQVDCLVNNAGITFNSPFLNIKSEQLDVLMNVNLTFLLFLPRIIAADMIQHGQGVICNLSSIHGLQQAPEHSAYAATKGAIIASTRALAVELGHKGIRLNAIAPGWITVDSYYERHFLGFDLDQAKEQAKNSVPRTFRRSFGCCQIGRVLMLGRRRIHHGTDLQIDGGTTALMSLISDFRNESTARFGREYLPDRERAKM